MTRSAWLRWTLGLFVSAALIVVAYRGTDGRVIVDTITQAKPEYVILGLICLMVTLVVRSWRWMLCFEPRDQLTAAQSVAAYGIGTASTQVVPSRLGDLVRVYVLGVCSGVSKSKALGTLVVERLADLFTVVLILTLALPFFDLPTSFKVADVTGAVLAFAALVVVYLLALAGPEMPEPGWIARQRLLHAGFLLLIQLLAGFSAVRSPGRAALIMLTSFVVWGFTVMYYALSFWAVGLPLGWSEGALVTGVLALAAIVPSGPSFAGSFDLAARTTLGQFGIDPSRATGYLNFTRISGLVSIVAFTIVALIALKAAWRENGTAAPTAARDPALLTPEPSGH